jgi:purine nucleosidase
MRQKIIIDTDPGQDDAIAILLALASPKEIDLLGIVAVAGNVPLDLAKKNALKVVEISGFFATKVYAGCDRPLKRKLVTAENVHGKTGLDGPVLPEPKIKLQKQHGVDFIIEALREHESKTITLCPLGPLTNIASAMIKAPDIIPRIKEIVLMGGAYFEVGNVTPAAEFNIYVDPEAADIVLRSGVPITMLPLDVTHQVLTTEKRIKKIESIGNYTAKIVAQMCAFFERFDEAKYGSDGAPLHDPCVIAYLLKPKLFEGRQVNVQIETQSELTLGMSVADYWGITDKKTHPRNVNFIRNVNAKGFYKLLTKRLAILP